MEVEFCAFVYFFHVYSKLGYSTERRFCMCLCIRIAMAFFLLHLFLWKIVGKDKYANTTTVFCLQVLLHNYNIRKHCYS